MGIWRIKEWSRELGRGAIFSPQLGALDFDASVATVDDFKIGEIVEIELNRSGEVREVAFVTPENLRLGPTKDMVNIPPLSFSLSHRYNTMFEGMLLDCTYEVESLKHNLLTLVGRSDYPPTEHIYFRGVEYVELPMIFQSDQFRLSTPTERGIVGRRLELENVENKIFVTIIDGGDFFFVVADEISVERSS